MPFQNEFFTQLDQFSSSPYLFIGSGVSRRYLSSESWEGLLRKYASEMGRQFERYRSLAGGDWPRVGKLIGQDYHPFWFEDPSKEEERDLYVQDMVDYSSPLKASISNHLLHLSDADIPDEHMKEIELFKGAKISGIITTNYDLLSERFFPDFKVYKSQGELIFSQIQEVGEIYKIHGCCTEPNTLVLTEDDYKDFIEKNAYLAAKLLAVFMEHPTIFIGYSISDPNIRAILSSIIRCLDQSQVNQLSERLYFVQYDAEIAGGPILEKFEFEIGGSILPLTRIRASDFKGILTVLNQLTQKFSAAMLRRIKEHIYELINTNDPSEKISVVDFDEDTDLNQVDVVIGVGVAHHGEKSYETYTRFDIAEDILNDDKEFNVSELLSKTLPKLIKATTWVPVFKYYQQQEDKENIDAKIKIAANRPLDEFKRGNPYHYKEQTIKESFNNIEDVLQVNEPSKAINVVLLMDVEKLDIDRLEQFLKDNFELTKDPQKNSYYMKLLCLYDRLKYN